MSVDHAGQGHPAHAPRTGVTPVVAVLMWVFVGWPVSWIVLILNVPLGLLVGIASTIAMIVACARAGQQGAAAPGPAPLPVGTRQQAVRYEVESLAVITPIGGCGWCGSLVAHVNDDGHPIPPRYWHTVEIEERIRTKLQT